MRYFIIRGLLPQPVRGSNRILGLPEGERRTRQREWRRLGLPMPIEGLHIKLRMPNVGQISVLVHDVQDALLIVSAPSQRKAYSLGLPFLSFCAIYLGVEPSQSEYEALLELREKPQGSSSTHQIAESYANKWPGPRPDSDLLAAAIQSGPFLHDQQIDDACAFVSRVLSQNRFAWALTHLKRSHDLFCGFMSPSYYYGHYQHDRRSESAYIQEKKYLEERTRYDLAFLSAFRSLEALIGVPKIRGNEIGQRLMALDAEFGTSFATEKWHSFHEVFSSGRKLWKLPKLLSHYLRLRNAVAAHANPNAPLKLREDQVYEIQMLAASMLRMTMSVGDA